MSGALEGVRVLDLSDARGFLAGKILADMGADVIKLEPPGGDPLRQRGPFLGGVVDPERSLPWLALNTSKRGITLNLEAERGRELYRGLLETADVVLECFAPGELDALGLGYATLHEALPQIVHCAITPFGQTGPYAAYRGHDLVVVAMGGNAALTGDPDRPPLRCSMPTAYYHAAPEAALGISFALLSRDGTGRGQFVDVSLQECQLQTLLSAPGQHALRPSPQHRTGARTGRTREIWEAKDGYVTFGLRGGPARIPNLIATVEYMAAAGEAPEWLRAYDWSSFNHNTLSDAEIERLEAAFGAFFRARTMRELYEEALERRILLAPCNDARELFEHPQLRDRDFFVTVEYPELGASIEQPGFFARTSQNGIRVRGRAPRIGEHNAEVLGRVAGYSSEQITALESNGTLARGNT